MCLGGVVPLSLCNLACFISDVPSSIHEISNGLENLIYKFIGREEQVNILCRAVSNSVVCSSVPWRHPSCAEKFIIGYITRPTWTYSRCSVQYRWLWDGTT